MPRPETIHRPTKLASLQALRGVAALGVVLFHLLHFEPSYLPGIAIAPVAFTVGRAGVDLFFVLSGFFVSWTTMGCPGGLAESGRFLLRRLTRIYPTYWVYCLLLIGARALEPLRFGADTDVLASVLLLPTGKATLLLVSWTLVFEVYFYLTFAAALWLGRQAWHRLALLGFWVVGVVAARWLLSPSRADVTLDLLLSPLVLEFFAGCMAAWLTDALLRAGVTARVWLGVLAGGLLAVVLAFVFTDTLYAHPWWRVGAFGVGAGTLVVGCVGSERWLGRLVPRGLIILGDVSYSLYLSHLITLAVIGVVWSRTIGASTPANHAAALIVATGMSVVVAVLAHRFTERPLLRGLRRLDETAIRIGRPVAA